MARAFLWRSLRTFTASSATASSCRRKIKMRHYLPRRIGGQLGIDPSAGQRAARAHVDVLFTGLAPLGQSQADAGSAPRRVVGREQNRSFAPAYRNAAGLAGDLPRRTPDRGRCASTGLGLALFDLEAPEHCIKRGDEWIFGPQEVYEQRGDVDNVVFPCGYTIAPDGDTIHLYYGAADTSIAHGHREPSRHSRVA